MTQNEDELKTERVRLSHVLDVRRLKKGRANIIKAPCDSGKTTAVMTRIIPELAGNLKNVLYLIDTHAGRDALVEREKLAVGNPYWVHRHDPEWRGERCEHENGTVMTYHHFGYACEETMTFLKGIKLIICDEMHTLIRDRGIENTQNQQEIYRLGLADEEKCCNTALETLEQLSGFEHGPVIIILSATPKKLIERFVCKAVPHIVLDYTGKVDEDKTMQTVSYTNFASIVPKLTEKTLIFVSRINLMQKYAAMLEDEQRKIVCLWSVNSAQRMTDDQHRVRDALLANEHIPDDVDVLFLNAAYETSINIKNEDFKTVVIHCSNKDTQTQVRGRLRHDIDTMYVYDKYHENIADYFPEEYLGAWLPVYVIKEIAEEMDLKSAKGRQLKWPSVKKLLVSNGFSVEPRRFASGTRWKITRDAA